MYIDVNELDLLMEEQKNIRQKISTVMKKLKDWFIQKIHELGELIRNVKSSISEALRNMRNHDGKVDKNINVEGETVIKKGTPIKTVTNNVQSDLNNLQVTTKVVIGDCKDGIRYVDGDNKDMAIKTRTKIMNKIKDISLIVTPIMAGVLAIALYKKNESERKRFESRISRMKSDIASDVKKNVKSELRADKEAEEEAEYYSDLVSDVVPNAPTIVTDDKKSANGIKKTVKTIYKILDKLDKKGMI